MLRKIVFQILLLFIFQVFVAENAALQACSDNVTCLCGVLPDYDLKYFVIQNFSAEAENCDEFLSAACASNSCLYRPTDAPKDKTEKNHVLAKKRSLKLAFPPLDDDAEESHSKLRHRRFPKSCNDSISPIRHAVMDCSVWPEFITCEINCTHGYAMMEDGKPVLKTTRQCRESELTWKPKASFPVCDPYINCKPILVKPGDLNCKTSGPMISYCDISCEAYEDKNEVTKNRYECLDENFANTLPHCATVAKDVNLIPRPQTSQGPEKISKDFRGPQKSSRDPQVLSGPRKATRIPQ